MGQGPVGVMPVGGQALLRQAAEGLVHRIEGLVLAGQQAEFQQRRQGLGQALAARDQGAGIGPVLGVGPGAQRAAGSSVTARARGGMLCNGRRLARQQRFIHPQVVGRQQPGIGRHSVAFAEHQQVTPHHLDTGDALRPAVADHQRARAGQVAQGGQRPLGAQPLPEADQRREQHEGQQHQRLAHITQQQVQATCGEQALEHRLARHLAQQPQGRAPARRGQGFGAVGLQAACGFGGAQAARAASGIEAHCEPFCGPRPAGHLPWIKARRPGRAWRISRCRRRPAARPAGRHRRSRPAPSLPPWSRRAVARPQRCGWPGARRAGSAATPGPGR